MNNSRLVYDGLSRLRISRYYVRNANTDTLVLQNEKRRVYDGMEIVQERDGNNVTTASLTRTGNIGGILARTTDAGSVFYGYDGSGNVVTLTGSSGAEVGSYTYDAFGNIAATSGVAASENPYRFSTKEAIGGLYSYGFRFYSPGLGRWINRDPIGEAGGINLYVFAGNDPVNSGDEYGLWDWKKAINEWIFGAPKPCPENEEEEIGYASDTRQFAGRKAAQSWRIGAEVVMAAVPLPVPKGSGVATAVASSKSIWSSGKLTSVKNAFGHWQKHKKEFPELKNALEYVKNAQKFVGSPPTGTLVKIRGSDTLLYNSATNTFAVKASSGAPRTMFRPNNGMNYWNAQ